LGMIDQPQTPPPSSQFQEEVVLLWSLQKACLVLLYVYSSFMCCTYYWCSAQTNLQKCWAEKQGMFYSYSLKLGTENHWVAVIIITDAHQHKVYFCNTCFSTVWNSGSLNSKLLNLFSFFK
jgi:hypothetical protein